MKTEKQILREIKRLDDILAIQKNAIQTESELYRTLMFVKDKLEWVLE